MLTYTTKELPVGVTDKACDMYLVAAAKDGDHQAYTELCCRHSQRIFRTVLRITGNTADAEDTLQEALLKAYVHIRGFEGRSAFSSWLTRIAINSALMLSRKTRFRPVCSFESGPDADDFKLLNLWKAPTIPKNPAFRMLWKMNSPKRFDLCPLIFGL